MKNKYVSYKESNVQWIGMIPKQWSLTKIKNKCLLLPSNVDKKSHEDETTVKLCNYVDVYYNDYINGSIDFMEATANDREINKFQLNKEDVVITKDSEDPDDIAVPALVVETQKGLICGYHLSILRSNQKHKFSGSYLFWALKDVSIASQLHREATGITRWAIAIKHVKNSIIPYPSFSEQKAISSYLLKTCTSIDTTITIKQKQLETLDALKKSIIHKAVTQGLDDSVEMKDSGVDWIGKIPDHWKVKIIKRNFNITLGKMLQSLQKIETETEEYYLRSANIKW